MAQKFIVLEYDDADAGQTGPLADMIADGAVNHGDGIAHTNGTELAQTGIVWDSGSDFVYEPYGILYLDAVAYSPFGVIDILGGGLTVGIIDTLGVFLSQGILDAGGNSYSEGILDDGTRYQDGIYVDSTFQPIGIVHSGGFSLTGILRDTGDFASVGIMHNTGYNPAGILLDSGELKGAGCFYYVDGTSYHQDEGIITVEPVGSQGIYSGWGGTGIYIEDPVTAVVSANGNGILAESGTYYANGVLENDGITRYTLNDPASSTYQLGYAAAPQSDILGTGLL